MNRPIEIFDKRARFRVALFKEYAKRDRREVFKDLNRKERCFHLVAIKIVDTKHLTRSYNQLT